MAKQGHQKEIKRTVSPAKPARGNLRASNGGSFWTIELVVLLLYLFTAFFSRFDAVDVMGSQWLYVSVLNVLVSIYLFVNKRILPNSYFKSGLMAMYLAFLLICGLSFFVSFNIIESMVVYSRLLIGFIALLNIVCITHHNPKALHDLILFIGLVAFIQSVFVLLKFISNYPQYPSLNEIIYNIKGNVGNKNVLAASIVIKIPFVLYAIHKLDGNRKLFYLATLLLSICAILILNARASYISLFLELVVYLAFVSIFYLKGEGKKAVLINLGMIAGCFVVSILLFQLLFKPIVHEKIISDDGYGTLDERISSIGLSNEGSSGRIRLWNSAIDFIKKNPVLGGGYGNWKINSYNYEKYWQPRWSFGEIHVHNDFLETAADTGIAGGLIYLFIFILVFVYALKLLLTKQVSNEIKMLIMASLLASIAYCVDAFFNFPFEIPNIQILLVFIMAINIHYHIETNQAGVKEKNGNIYSNAIYGIILVSVFSTYISLKVFRSYEVQYKISKEWLGNTEDVESKFTSKEINSQLPTIPNINVATMPMACIKARYLINEKKYDEALSILNADNGSNNLLHYSDYLRSEISLALNQKDSAYYHAKAASLAWPANQQYYKFYSDMVAERKDTVELEKAFNEMSKLNPIPLFYLDYSQNYFLCTGNQEKRIAIIEDGLKKFPKNKKLNFQKSFLKALNEYKNKNYRSAIVEYQNALTFQADDKISKQTIAYSYCNLKEFDKALPYFTELIDGKAFSNGEMEFYRGICYINLNDQSKACLDFKAAINKGYPVNPDLVKSCK